MDWKNYLFSFQGRVNRAKYWLFVLVAFIVLAVAGGIIYAANGALVSIIIAAILYIALLVAGIAVGVKRLHDRAKSGWWLLLFFLGPSVLSWIGVALGRDSVGLIFSLAGLAISIWAFVELACLRGTVGPNEYGPDPLPSPGAAGAA